MNSRKRIWTALAALMLSLVMLSAGALSVFAADELTDETKAALRENVQNFLQEVFVYDDAMLDQVRENGGFYEVMVDAIRADRETLGDYVEMSEVVIDDSGDQITATSDVKFENYNGETILYFDYDKDLKTPVPKNFVINVDYPLSIRMAQAAQNTVTGLIVVFAVLFFLAFVISLFKYISPDVRKAKKEENGTAGTAAGGKGTAKTAAAPVKAAAAAPAFAAADEDDEIAAVIAAAIAAAQADMPSAEGYYVRSVRRRSGRNWKRA